MEKDKIINPFFTGRYAGAHYFCDRERDTETLIKHIVSGRNVALISPRRLGKSGLIHHTFSQPAIKDRYTTIHVDIYATKNLCEFAKALSEGIVKAIRPEKAWHEKFFSFLRSLRIGFRTGSISGEPSFDIGIGDIEHPDKTIKEAFEYMEASGRPFICRERKVSGQDHR